MSRTATARVKQDAASFPVPQNRDQAVDAIAAIGRHQRERQRIEANMNDELAKVRERYERQAAPHLDAIRGLSGGVQIWCTANRDTLTQGGKVKFSKLASGEIKWRITPPRVAIQAANRVLEQLKDHGLDRFIRVKEEIDREAILGEPEAIADIKGVSITQKEEFVILPFETELEEVL